MYVCMYQLFFHLCIYVSIYLIIILYTADCFATKLAFFPPQTIVPQRNSACFLFTNGTGVGHCQSDTHAGTGTNTGTGTGTNTGTGTGTNTGTGTHTGPGTGTNTGPGTGASTGPAASFYHASVSLQQQRVSLAQWLTRWAHMLQVEGSNFAYLAPHPHPHPPGPVFHSFDPSEAGHVWLVSSSIWSDWFQLHCPSVDFVFTGDTSDFV